MRLDNVALYCTASVHQILAKSIFSYTTNKPLNEKRNIVHLLSTYLQYYIIIWEAKKILPLQKWTNHTHDGFSTATSCFEEANIFLLIHIATILIISTEMCWTHLELRGQKKYL